MGFDLTTFLAQIVNLFLLIWILKRFLYRPVMDVIEKRQSQINHNIQEAEDKLSSASKLQQTLALQQEEFEKQRQKRLDQLDKEIEQHKTQMFNELERDYIARRQSLQDDLNRSWTAAKSQAQEMIASEFIALSQKILTEWSVQNPMDQLLTLFQKKIVDLSIKKQTQLQNLLLKQKSLQIITSHTLTKKQQVMIRGILQNSFDLPPKVRIQYKKRPDLILGLEMRIGNFLLDWNLNSYLDEMSQHLKQQIAGLIVPAERKGNK